MFKPESPAIFQKVVSDAIAKTQANRGFDEPRKKSVINAIAKAVIRIAEQGEFIHYDAEADRLTVWSQSSNLVYDLGPDGKHGCLAELNGAICWHRVAKRLIALYHAAALEAFCSPTTAGEAQASGQARRVIIEGPNFKDAPYMQPADTRRRQKIGGVWI